MLPRYVIIYLHTRSLTFLSRIRLFSPCYRNGESCSPVDLYQTAKIETAIVFLLSPSMAYRGTDNLRCYIREAGLPPMLCHPSTPQMPPEGHKSHLNNLKIRPESWRKLQTIHELKENRWERSICDCEDI